MESGITDIRAKATLVPDEANYGLKLTARLSNYVSARS